LAPTLPSHSEELKDLSCETSEDCYDNFPGGPTCESGYFSCVGVSEGFCTTVCPSPGRDREACDQFPPDTYEFLDSGDIPDHGGYFACTNSLEEFCDRRFQDCKDRCQPDDYDCNFECALRWTGECRDEIRDCCTEQYPAPNSVSE